MLIAIKKSLNFARARERSHTHRQSNIKWFDSNMMRVCALCVYMYATYDNSIGEHINSILIAGRINAVAMQPSGRIGRWIRTKFDGQM